MRIVLREFRWLRKDLDGLPWCIRYSFWLGAQRQFGYEHDSLLDVRGQRDPSPADMQRIRAHAIAAVRRLKTIRKIEKRIPIEFHVEQP